MNKKIIGIGAMVMTFVLGGLPQAGAVPVMTISDGTSTITVQDGGANDSSTDEGSVVWIGGVGVWKICVNTGLTKPISGTELSPMMDLNFVDSSAGAGILTISWTDDGFQMPGGTAEAAIGGTLWQGATLAYKTYVNGVEITSLDFSGSPFGGTDTGIIPNSVPFTLTQVVTITHPSAGVSSGNATLAGTPITDGGITAMLLGFVLLGVEGLNRRFRAEKK